MPSLALYQPDIPQNAGSMLRLCACLAVEAHVIEPAGFDMSDRALKRAGMDYLAHIAPIRHLGFGEFEAWRKPTGRRLVLLTTKAAQPYAEFMFRTDDIIMVGRESAGVPDAVHAAADARLLIPMAAGLRSLNVATAAAMVLGEALRQTSGFPVQAVVAARARTQ
ncbi:MAG TPA: tRNA (cytidine(34)-2'-O)-methyltransferase [Bauldia sp.]|nr:tRNA (cytidine(34)-2'-O)-methyltransferase [Bauldia sp.]